MLTWTEVKQGSAIILRLVGEFDLSESGAMKAWFEEKAASKVPYLILDFRGVQFIDSSGIATLIGYYKLAAEFRGKFALISVREPIMSVFNLVSLGTFFPIYATLEDAEAGLGIPK